jgi:hypothetical protein
MRTEGSGPTASPGDSQRSADGPDGAAGDGRGREPLRVLRSVLGQPQGPRHAPVGGTVRLSTASRSGGGGLPARRRGGQRHGHHLSVDGRPRSRRRCYRRLPLRVVQPSGPAVAALDVFLQTHLPNGRCDKGEEPGRQRGQGHREAPVHPGPSRSPDAGQAVLLARAGEGRPRRLGTMEPDLELHPARPRAPAECCPRLRRCQSHRHASLDRQSHRTSAGQVPRLRE